MATHAVIVAGSPGSTESRLGQLLEFFGVPYGSVAMNELGAASSMRRPDGEYVVLSSLEAFWAASKAPTTALALQGAAAVYLYPTPNRAQSERALQELEGWTGASLRNVPARTCILALSSDLHELAGPMAGISVSARPRQEDCVLGASTGPDRSALATFLTIDGAPAFLRFEHRGVPTFICTSGAMLDIDQPLAGAFFDVKEYFCSVVPLVMFMRWAFRDTMWRPQESGACLIVDDPLLKPRYGFCDFHSLLELMDRHDFTTNIAFIPWNWRRTSPTAGGFFRGERYSVSIHGCDHTAREFGDTSVDLLHGKASLAQSRMRKHQKRTGITHDPILVFPQGVFSSLSPGVLKQHGFMAAVNTEVNPVDHGLARTLVRDVWDVAIMRYGSFPIFTRRYASHGLENFAFDLLIGKPCLIVAHHDFFSDGGAALIELVLKLNSLRCPLTWRSLGNVLRRACRRRTGRLGFEEIEMYGTQLVASNLSDSPLQVVVRKKETDAALVAAVRVDGGDLEWGSCGEGIVFSDVTPPRREVQFSLTYKDYQHASTEPGRTFRYQASVAARRFLSEFRDNHWRTRARKAPTAGRYGSSPQ